MNIPVSFRALFLCAALCTPTAAQSFKLNGPLARGPSGLGVLGEVSSFLLSASGERVVYQAFEEGDAAPTLHSVRTAERRERVRLQAGLPTGWFGWIVRATYFTADEGRVLYTAPGSLGLLGLHSEPVDGSGPPVNLSRPPVPDVLDDDVPALLPDGQRVAFLAGYPERGLFVAAADDSSLAFLLSADLSVLRGGWSSARTGA